MCSEGQIAEIQFHGCRNALVTPAVPCLVCLGEGFPTFFRSRSFGSLLIVKIQVARASTRTKFSLRQIAGG